MRGLTDDEREVMRLAMRIDYYEAPSSFEPAILALIDRGCLDAKWLPCNCGRCGGTMLEFNPTTKGRLAYELDTVARTAPLE